MSAPDIVRGRDLIDHWAAQHPRRLALKSSTTSLNFGELRGAVAARATELQAFGIEAGDVVAFQLPNWAEAFVLYHAIVAIDAIALPMMPPLRDRDLGYMLHEARARLFVVPSVWRGVDHLAMARRVCAVEVTIAVMPDPATGSGPMRDAGRGEAPQTATDTEPVAPSSLGAPPGSLDAVCSLIFTSGTSGRPKGVVYTHRILAIEGRDMAAADGVDGDDVLFVPSAIAHVAGLAFGTSLPLHAGAGLCLLPEWNGDHAVEMIARQHCTWAAGATPFLQALVQAAQARPGVLASLRVFRCGGASVPPTLIRQARALGVDAYRSFGMSEHSSISGRAGQPDAVCTHADGVLHPLIDVRIVDPADPSRERPVNEEGEILTRGPDQSLGYLRAAETATSRHEGWLMTGDLGTLSADRVLRITGRKKDLIIRKGENIGAKEIEDVLAEHPAVAGVAVVGVPDAERGEMVCCVVVASASEPPTLAHLCRHLTERGLPMFKLPERLALLPQLPVNAGGKVRKLVLRAWLAGDVDALTRD